MPALAGIWASHLKMGTVLGNLHFYTGCLHIPLRSTPSSSKGVLTQVLHFQPGRQILPRLKRSQDIPTSTQLHFQIA